MVDNIKAIFSRFIDLLYPPHCMLCNDILELDGVHWLCQRCFANIESIQSPTCQKCGSHLENESQTHCANCSFGQSSLKADRNYSFMLYDDIARELIYSFKYSGYKEYGEGLIDVISKKMDLDFIRDADIIIPVPLHKNRLKERGFNQSEILAYYLSKKTETPMIKNVLNRTKDTAKQSLLEFGARDSNLKNAFSVDKSELIANKKIILIDDIFTSGSTISECSRVLFEKEAKSVISFTIFKTSPHDIQDDL